MLSKLIGMYVDRTTPQPSEDQIRKDVERRHNEAATAAAQRFSRGSVAIQEGAFIMKDELEATIKHKTKR